MVRAFFMHISKKFEIIESYELFIESIELSNRIHRNTKLLRIRP